MSVDTHVENKLDDDKGHIPDSISKVNDDKGHMPDCMSKVNGNKGHMPDSRPKVNDALIIYSFELLGQTLSGKKSCQIRY